MRPDGAAGDPAHHVARVESARLTIARRWRVDLGSWRMVMINPGERTIAFTTPLITGRKELLPGWRYAGPLMTPPPVGSPAGDRPLVYVALGTFFNGRPEVFRAAMDALADEPVEVTVSTGRRNGGLDLGSLPTNVELHDYVDSRAVLARAQAHVTHGGCSSVHESLLAGVPMVCVPQGSDQFAWSERIEELGAGHVVEVTPAAIREAVRSQLEDDRTRQRATDLSRHLLDWDGEDTVRQALGEALAHGSASGPPLPPRAQPAAHRAP